MLPRFSQCKSVLAVFICLALTLLTIQPAQAGQDEMALFFDELVPYGDWVDYKQYGPVWYPTKDVDESWRPYLDGRWVPSAKGWVFETKEPWGWATYHFGNWMATQEYGWVWVPGSTWYPSTATWRTCKKEGKEAIGWAPVPPPNYEPEPAFVPAGGFPAETQVQDQLIPALYVFAEGPAFIQGMNQPYAQEYSYMNSGGLVPPEQLPELFPLTQMVNNFVSAALDPEAVANWGPPLDQVSECTGVSPMALMNTTNGTDVTVVQNCWPPPMVLSRRAYFVTLLPTTAYVVRPVVMTGRGGPWHLYGHGHLRLHDGIPHVRHDWAHIRGGGPGPHPKFASKPFSDGGRHPPFLGLPIKATSFGGIKRGGGPFTASSGKLPLPGAVPWGTIRKGLPPAPAGSKGPIPVATDRRAQLAQERTKMEEQKRQMQQAKLGGVPEGPGPGKLGPRPEPGVKAVLPGEHARTPVAKTAPTLATPSIAPGAAKAALTRQTPTPGQPPPTAEQLKQQREAKKQEEIKQLQQKQQTSGIAPSGQIASPSGSARPPGGGPGMGSASTGAPGAIRPPKGSSGPAAGGPGGPAPGGFGIRSPKGGGTGSGPMGSQPSVAGRQGGPVQTPRVQTQQVRPPTPPKSGGGGGGGGKSASHQKKQEKKP